MKMEMIVKRFYDGLEEGKLLGRRCKDCGTVEFPPVIACNKCGSTDVEWIEMSGNGEMTEFSLPAVLSIKPENQSLMPYCFGCVTTEEGSSFNVIVRGVSKKNKKEVWEKLPVPVKAEIIQRDGFKTIVYNVVE